MARPCSFVSGQLLVAHTGKIALLDTKTFALELADVSGPVLDALGKPSNNVPFMMLARIASTPSEDERHPASLFVFRTRHLLCDEHHTMPVLGDSSMRLQGTRACPTG